MLGDPIAAQAARERARIETQLAFDIAKQSVIDLADLDAELATMDEATRARLADYHKELRTALKGNVARATMIRRKQR